MADRKRLLWIWLAAALVVAGILSPFASSFPDGLERVAEDLGFIQQTQDAAHPVAMPDYSLPFIGNSAISTGLAGVVGVLITFLILWGIGKLLLGKKKTREPRL